MNTPLGDWTNGEIQIVTDVQLIEKIVAQKRKELSKLGSKNIDEESKIGIISDDQYLIIFRDAVIFPPKKGEKKPYYSTYLRIVYKYEFLGNLGVSILPMNVSDNKIILNLNYRHALRGFSCELPGNISRENENEEDTVRRCVHEELGGNVIELKKLTPQGFVSERGFIGGKCPIFQVYVDGIAEKVSDPTILGHLCLTKDEFKQNLIKGFVEVDGRKYHFCDGYTSTAFLLAELNGFI